MQLYDWVAWIPSLDGSQHRHFSGLRQVKINSQLSYYIFFLILRQLEIISIESDQFPVSLITLSGEQN